MKIHNLILTFALILLFESIYAHQDRRYTIFFGNVRVRITTGFEYEEITKVANFGRLAEHLAKNMKYSKPIFLDYEHHYTKYCDPDYFISFDQGKINDYVWSEYYPDKNVLKKKGIVIRQVSRQFDAQTTLKLLEYAIANSKNIESIQKEIKYDKNYCTWLINTIDTIFINNLLLRPNSDQLNNALSLKIERPGKIFEHGVSYFIRDNKYWIFSRGYKRNDTTLLKLDNIYDLERIGESMIVFDTDSSFYFIDNEIPKASKRHIIKDKGNFYNKYTVDYIGGEKLSIYIWYDFPDVGTQPNRNLIYFTDLDELIQDLDKVLNNRKSIRPCEYTFMPEVEWSGDTVVYIQDVMSLHNTEYNYKYQYVITNDSLYRELKNIDTINIIDWPVINFEEEILVGKYTENTGCNVDSNYKLTKDNSGYVLTIRNFEKGYCEKLIKKTHWVKIARKGDVTVSFKIINGCDEEVIPD